MKMELIETDDAIETLSSIDAAYEMIDTLDHVGMAVDRARLRCLVDRCIETLKYMDESLLEVVARLQEHEDIDDLGHKWSGN